MERRCLLVFLIASLQGGILPEVQAQEKSDSTRIRQLAEKIRNAKATQQVIARFSRPLEDTVFNVKSEDIYLPYEGKVIRRIIIEHVGFDRSVIDTTRNIRTYFANAANRLHTNTRSWVVRDNLFIKAGEPVNSFRIADNERYLRDKDFILDARIYPRPIADSPDSVDLLVVTRDVFSLGASVTPVNGAGIKVNVQDANLSGMGQRVEYSQLYDATRHPRMGSELLYRKNNLAGSFTDATIDYTTLNTGSSLGNENETALYIRLNRALYMPYTRWAGGMEWSTNFSRNVTAKPDSSFARYQYNIADLWAGYSFGHQKKKRQVKENRNRKFFALRGFQENFSRFPAVSLPLSEQFYYRNRQSLLAQLTFFRQDFYKTRYVLGFGRTEDVPYGYRLSFTGGLEKETGRTRPYADAEWYHNFVRKTGTFFIYNVKLASFYNQRRSEEGIILFDITRYSRVYLMGRYKVRHQLESGYTRQFTRTLKRPLDINETNGITGLRADSLYGDRRLILNTQTIVYTPWKFLGFRLAPMIRIDMAYLAKQNEVLFQHQNFLSGWLLGLRARNENLIFNTLEGRMIYYPRTIEGSRRFRFDFRANIRIKYPTTLVTAPATFYDPQNTP